MLPQIHQSLIPQTTFFHYEMSKSLEMIFQYWRIFPANVGPTDVKNLLNSLAISCDFCIMVLLTLIPRGRRFDFCILFTTYYFHNLPRPLRICFILMQQF